MRIILFIQVLLYSHFYTINTQAQERYKILFLNISPIEIGGKQCQVNDCFSATENIHWKNAKQVMKVMCMRTQRQSVIAAQGFKQGKHKTLSSYLSQNKRLSTRDGSPMLLSQLKDYLTDTFYLIDSIEVKTLLPINNSHFFYADYCYKGDTIHKRLPKTEQGFLIDFSLFTIDGHHITPFETNLSIFYLDSEKGEAIPITKKMHLIPIR